LPASLTVRTATIRDVPPLVTLINAAFVVERHFVDRDRTDVDEVAAYLEKGTFLIAESADGGFDASVYLETHGDRGYIGMLAVSPKLQGRGIGRQMMTAAEQYCSAAGCRAIDIRIVNLRTELPPFYRKLGYADCGTAPFDDPRLTKPAHFMLMAKALA
jgi:ribosomal protein S18 acetylase RimI-like enzyme